MLGYILKIISIMIISSLCLSTLSFAVSEDDSGFQINATIVNENPDKKVIKYVIRYKPVDDDAAELKEVVFVPDRPISVGEDCRIVLDVGSGGSFYLFVQDFYEDGTNSTFSEQSFPIVIPYKVTGLRITE